MSTRFSLIWDEGREVITNREKRQSRAIVKDMQLDRSFRQICPDALYREVFLNVLTTPSKSPAEIKRRRDVIEEFYEKPALLDKLTEQVRRMGIIKNNWDTEKSRTSSQKHMNSHDKNVILSGVKDSLVLTAHYLQYVIVNVRDIHETLNMMGAVSENFVRLREQSAKISRGKAADYLLMLAGRIEHELPSSNTYSVEYSITEEMRSAGAFLADFSSTAAVYQPEKKQKGLLSVLMGLKSGGNEAKREEEKLHSTDVSGISTEENLEQCISAARGLDRYLTSIARTIYDRFSSIEDELYFCKAAVCYLDFLKDRRIRHTYPEILPAEENIVEIEGLSDLLLLVESMSIDSVVPNDVSLGSDGILVTGKNNSGKTVYLRSIGCAVLLGQCGLPIPAVRGRISIRSRIFTSFASAEGELMPNSTAGRFEEEVAQVRQILDEMEENSLVFLNETFQTTSYDEGSDAMEAILAYLSEIGCAFIFVTHLTKLIEKSLSGGKNVVMKTSDEAASRYKLSRIG